jgi:hypothetical protein
MSNYPHAPGFKAVTTETSAEAALSMKQKAKAILDKALVILSAYPEGLISGGI